MTFEEATNFFEMNLHHLRNDNGIHRVFIHGVERNVANAILPINCEEDPDDYDVFVYLSPPINQQDQ